MYCASGIRSLQAARQLEKEGWTKIHSMEGGIKAWKDQGGEVHYPSGLNSDQIDRYSRHLLLGEIGLEGQEKLLRSKVLILGTGGLGAPAALYLAAAGVGHIGLADHDRVERSNLQRQIIHAGSRVGMSKTQSAQIAIQDLNSDVQVQSYPLMFDQTTGASPFLQVGVKPVNVGLMSVLNAQNQAPDMLNKL